jgi:hypothetical protein
MAPALQGVSDAQRVVVRSLRRIDRHPAHGVFCQRRSCVTVLMPVPVFVLAMRHDSADSLLMLLLL